jgi:hypothetical protein
MNRADDLIEQAGPPMSELGQKATFPDRRRMSASASKADVVGARTERDSSRRGRLDRSGFKPEVVVRISTKSSLANASVDV